MVFPGNINIILQYYDALLAVVCISLKFCHKDVLMPLTFQFFPESPYSYLNKIQAVLQASSLKNMKLKNKQIDKKLE